MDKITISEKEDHVIIVKCTEQAAKECLLPLLNGIKSRDRIGHSFDIIVDPEDNESEKFSMDGDGGAHIRNLWDNGKEYDSSEFKK